MLVPTATWHYVYGIIPSSDLAIFDSEGLDPAHDVHTVVEGDLAVVTSGVDRDSLHELDRGTAVRYLSAHQRVLETVVRDYPVLPVKFGTTLPDEETLRVLLRQGHTLLNTTLNTYAGKQQHEVVVLWDLKQVFQDIAAEEPISALRTQITQGTAEATANERITLGQMVHAALQRRSTQISEQVVARLRDLADDLIINPKMDDSMVVNVALLLDDTRQGDLDERLEELDTFFGGQLQIRCVGPLPPYSFATLEVQVLPFEVVDAARQQLGLATTTSTSEIKHVYRQRAAQAHPDLNPRADTAAVMEALSASYRLISTIAKAQSPVEGDESSDCACHLDRAAVERTLLLRVVRHEGAQQA